MCIRGCMGLAGLLHASCHMCEPASIKQAMCGNHVCNDTLLLL